MDVSPANLCKKYCEYNNLGSVSVPVSLGI